MDELKTKDDLIPDYNELIRFLEKHSQYYKSLLVKSLICCTYGPKYLEKVKQSHLPSAKEYLKKGLENDAQSNTNP